MVIMGVFLLSTGIMACSSATVSETEVSAAYDFSRNIFIENRNNKIGDDILRQYAVLFPDEYGALWRYGIS